MWEGRQSAVSVALHQVVHTAAEEQMAVSKSIVCHERHAHRLHWRVFLKASPSALVYSAAFSLMQQS